MNRIGNIESPQDCPYNENICGNHFCGHPSMSLRYCTWTNEFPVGCPLKKEHLFRRKKIERICQKMMK